MKPFFFLPFDHRSGFVRDVFGKPYPPTPAVGKRVQALKRIIYDGFLLAFPAVAKVGTPAILVDEEFGLDIFLDAKRRGIVTALSTEKSGSAGFTFEHGRGFGRALVRRNPTYAKALVHYHIGDDELNAQKVKRLAELSDVCAEEGIGLVLEPLLDGKGSPRRRALAMVRDFTRAGIRPTIWKLEGLPRKGDWKALAKVAKAPMIVLGRGESKTHVENWVKTAATSGVVDGFAIGRTIFLEPLRDVLAKRCTRTQAAERIAKNYLHFVKLWTASVVSPGRH